jgi:hypothetical protein
MGRNGSWLVELRALKPVLGIRIQIRRIRMFLGLQDLRRKIMCLREVIRKNMNKIFFYILHVTGERSLIH